MDNTNGSCDKDVINMKERINSKGTENETNFKEHRDVTVKNAATNSQQVSSKRSFDDNNEALGDDDDDTKRRKLTGDERLKRNRERNRMHARKTRERKKKQSFALQQRISELKIESNLLRQMIDERFTACALLGLSQQTNQDGESIPIMSSATICKKSTNHNGSDVAENMNSENASPIRRARRRGKYSPQERERIRRERNRMHAKRTRDKKKLFLEASEQVIYEMETESRLLREYLVSVKLISLEDSAQSEQRTIQSKKELAMLKAYSLQHDGNDEDDDVDEDDDDDEHDQANNQDFSNYDDNDDGDDEQGYHSGSDEKGSWGGSNDGSNQDSTNGETSVDGDNSGSDKSRRTSSSLSNVSSTSVQFERNQSSGTTSRDGSTGSDNGNSGDNGSDNGNSGDNGSGSNSSDDQPN